MGATSSVFTAQQISIQCREVTWENISCVSEGQGEKLQLAVYNSSTLLSYWFCPRFWLGSGRVAAFGGALWLSSGTLGEKTPPRNKWLECVTLTKSPKDACFLRQSFSLFAATVLGMLLLTTSRSSAKRSRQGLPNETDLTWGFKCTLFVHAHIRGVSDVQRKVEMDGKRAEISNRPTA